MTACKHRLLSPRHFRRRRDRSFGLMSRAPYPLIGLIGSSLIVGRAPIVAAHTCGHLWEPASNSNSRCVRRQPRQALQMPVVRKNFFDSSVTSAIAGSSLAQRHVSLFERAFHHDAALPRALITQPQSPLRSTSPWRTTSIIIASPIAFCFNAAISSVSVPNVTAPDRIEIEASARNL